MGACKLACFQSRNCHLSRATQWGFYVMVISRYGFDPSYAVEVQCAYPDCFAIFSPCAPENPAVGETVDEWKRTAGVVAVLLMLGKHLGLGTGMYQPRKMPATVEAWADLPKVLALAKRPNTVIKVSGACILSTQHYPHDDIWDNLQRHPKGRGHRAICITRL